MKRVCIQVGHYNIENITSDGLRSWRSSTALKRSTGASGERIYHWDKVMPILRDKLIAAGVAVHIATAIFEEEIYRRDYDLWVSLHYDGGGSGERCMISAPNRATQPRYLNESAQSQAERFAQIWRETYPDIVGVPNRDDFITAGMKDYYAYDYVPYDTPACIIEHFNHTSPRGTYLKEHPELVAEADFKAIAKFLGLAEQPPVLNESYQIVYKGEVLQEYEKNPADRIMELTQEVERKASKVAELTKTNAEIQADLDDANDILATSQAELTKVQTERDDAKAALATAEKAVKTLTAELQLCRDKIEKLKSTDPLKGYDGWELVRRGFSKIFRRG
jgi:rRNA maturation endonuclease Nob1